MTFEWEWIHVAYRVIDGQHTFYSTDMRVMIAHADRAEAAAQMVHLAKELSRWNVRFYITAYDRLGPELKALRETLGEGTWMTVAYDLGSTPPSRTEVTLIDFIHRLPDLDPAAVAVAMQNFVDPASLTCLFPGDPAPEPPPPVYASWSDYLVRTTWAERLKWCARKAKKANEESLFYAPAILLTRENVWDVMAKARGRCAHCGSLAVEKKPYDPTLRERTPWAPVGRRVGSLGHARARFFGGGNDAANLIWSCLWCNTWVSERRPSATDHGGFHPKDDGKAPPVESMAPRIALTPEQRKTVRSLFIFETPVEYDKAGEPIGGGTWYRDSEDALEVRGRRIATFGAAVKWLQSLPPEEREVAIKEMQDEAELTGDIDGEFLPDHECPWDTAMWRDTFGRE